MPELPVFWGIGYLTAGKGDVVFSRIWTVTAHPPTPATIAESVTFLKRIAEKYGYGLNPADCLNPRKQPLFPWESWDERLFSPTNPEVGG